MSHSEPEHNRQPEGEEPDEPFPKIGQLADGSPGHVVTESLPASDEQDWTEETVHEIIVDAFNSAGEVRPSQLIAQRVNAALAAEREAWGSVALADAQDTEALRQQLAAERFEVWNKAALEIEKLRTLLQKVEPFVKAWAMMDLDAEILQALEPPPQHTKD